MMNFDYVRLLSVELSLLMMNLSYRLLVIICFLLFAYVSLDSSSAQNEIRCRVQIGRMQCKLCTNAVQTLSNEVLTNKAVHEPKFEKRMRKSKNTKRKTQTHKYQCSPEIYERAVQNHNQCITCMIY